MQYPTELQNLNTVTKQVFFIDELFIRFSLFLSFLKKIISMLLMDLACVFGLWCRTICFAFL